VTRKSLKLMVVEDETLISMELEDFLEDLGHRVIHVAAPAERALTCLQRTAPTSTLCFWTPTLAVHPAFPSFGP
jgi:CheY-like chemotaxis protein